MGKKSIRIGGGSGYWGDATRATPQLLADGGLDFLVYDYLAEITMSIMARARAKDSQLGYAVDFVSAAMAPNLKEIARQNVRVIANAGGVNPQACAKALQNEIERQQLCLKVACVVGDDLIKQKNHLAQQNISEMFSLESFPAVQSVQSINAYLGAFPIAFALDHGADIVITGRCVDSAVTLGAAIHSFAWHRDQFDLLAAGSLAGHILECGTQATGGNFTDWELVKNDLDVLGYPIVELNNDGTFSCTKPKQSGGLVSVGTVAEQMLYEIGDPKNYLLPDVICDFSRVEIEQVAPDQVSVCNVVGRAPSSFYKVSATYFDQFRGGVLMTYYGIDAEAKARCQALAIFRAARRVLMLKNLDDFSETSAEILGAESQYGTNRKSSKSREVVLKIAAKHTTAQGVSVLFKESVGLGLASPPGLSGFQGGRPKPSPVVRLFSFELDKSAVPVSVLLGSRSLDCVEPHESNNSAELEPHTVSASKCEVEALVKAGLSGESAVISVPLIALAWGRSGDKGDKANIGIIARKAEYYPYICQALSIEVVAQCFSHFIEDSKVGTLFYDVTNESSDTLSDEQQLKVERFLLPGTHAMNFLLHDVLGGGGIASLRNDPQAKGYAQLLLEMPVEISQDVYPQISHTASSL